MALKKDEICVWLCQVKQENRMLTALLACPHSRLREIHNRLQSAAAKKVKGNRLPDLDYSALDAATLPFCEEYFTTLFRVADLTGFFSLYYPKTSRLEASVFARAGLFLKEQYPDCRFIVYSDPKQVRPSTLQSWIRKSQLHAESVPESAEASVFLQTAALAAQAAFSLDVQPACRQAAEKIRRLLAMNRRWELARPASLYLDQIPKEEAPFFLEAAERLPGLLEKGILEKWMRKGLPDSFFSRLCSLLDQGIEPAFVLESQPARLFQQAEMLLKEREKASRPFPEKEFEEWAALYWQHLQTLPLASQSRMAPFYMEEKGVSGTIRQLLESWMEKEKPVLPALHQSVSIRQKEEQIQILETPYMELLEKGAGLQAERLQGKEIPCDEFETLLKALSVRCPLPSVFLDENLLDAGRRWSIETNRFLPFAALTESAQAVLDHTDFRAEKKDIRSARETGAPRLLFAPAVNEKLSEEQRLLLMQIPLDIRETRLLADAFARGLSAEKAAGVLLRPNASVYRLVRPYLYRTKVQRFLDSLDSRALQQLLNRPSLKLSAMEVLAGLAAEGIPAVWLQANLKGNMSTSQVLALKKQFPFGTLPYAWQCCFPMPQALFSWLFDQKAAAFPKADPEMLRRQLAQLNTGLLSLLFQKKTGSSEKTVRSVCKEGRT